MTRWLLSIGTISVIESQSQIPKRIQDLKVQVSIPIGIFTQDCIERVLITRSFFSQQNSQGRFGLARVLKESRLLVHDGSGLDILYWE